MSQRISFTAVFCLALAVVSPAAGDVLISEFMANNASTLTDEDGEYSDWIEVYNSGPSAVDLLDWSLTDNPANLTKWRFPATNLPPRSHLVVFASNKDRRVPGAPLHTNFRLDANPGEFLALVRPDGTNVATQFSPQYPRQFADVSYGFGLELARTTLLTTGAVGRFFVPTNGALGATWTATEFNDAAWTAATNGAGYETGANEYGFIGLPAETLLAGPTGYWRLNETNGSTAVNLGSLGSAGNGALQNGVTLVVDGPRPSAFNGFEADNGAARFDGVNDKIDVPFAAALNPSAFTVECWARVNGGAGSLRSPLSSRDDLPARGWSFYAGTGNQWEFWTGTGSGWHIASGPAVAVGQWAHLVGTYDGINKSFYVNGVLVALLPGSFSPNTAQPLRLGAGATESAGGNFFFNGDVDEVAVLGRALSGVEIFRRYQTATNGVSALAAGPALVQSAGPAGYWRLDEAGGAVAANLGSLGGAGRGTYSNGVAQGVAGLRPPAFHAFEATNNAARFDGLNDKIDVPYAAALNPAVFTVEFWAKVNGGASTLRSPVNSREASPPHGYQFYAAGNNRWEFWTANGTNTHILSGPTVVTGAWTHVVGVFDGATKSLYVNGALAGSAATNFFPNTNRLLRLGAGRSEGTGGEFFPGELDEVAVYGRALSAAEILQHYHIATNGVPPPVTNFTYASLIRSDVRAAMQGVNSSAYLRIPFTLADPSLAARLTLRMKYDDGFIAHLNGQRVASVNAPVAVDWNSSATNRHANAEAVVFEEFDVSDWQGALRTGTNVLAIQGLNVSAGNLDVLLLAELEMTAVGTLDPTPHYFSVPTPGALNGAGTADLGPVIAGAGHVPALPRDDDDLTVTARVLQTFSPIATVALNYRVMSGELVSVTMVDDGNSGDGPAGDGIFGATIPAGASLPRQMVRYFVTAVDTAARAARWPLFEDPLGSPEYLGTVIGDGVTNSLPLFQWFAANPAAARTPSGTRGAVFFNGEFFDNAAVCACADTAVAGSQKFTFNPGYKIRVSDAVGRVPELILAGNGSDPAFVRQSLAFETLRQAGVPAGDSFPVLMTVNGNSDRVGIFVEQADGDFLKRRGLDANGALYQFVQRAQATPALSDATDGVEKKTRLDEGRADLQAVVDGLARPTAAQRAAFLFDHFNVPELINYLAARTVAEDVESVPRKFLLYRDTNGDREWTVFPWDKDVTFGMIGGAGEGAAHPFLGAQSFPLQPGGQWNVLLDVVFNLPATREMYLRRLRSVMEAQLEPPGTPPASGLFEQRVDAWSGPAAAYLPAGTAGEVTALRNFFPARRTDLFVTHAATNAANPQRAGIPEAQPANAVITMGEIDYNPASSNQAQEYIQFTNANGFAVDVSGWRLSGAATHTFKPGTVLPAGGALYLSPDVTAFRARTSGPRGGQGLFVQGRYSGQLSAWGETLWLTNASGALVASNLYPGAPSAAQRYLRVTEIMYRPSPLDGNTNAADEFEYLELKNIGPAPLDLNGVHFTNGILFHFSGSAVTNLGAGATVLLVKNLAMFAARYPGPTNIAGPFTGSLDNGGETLRLDDAVGEKILDFAYDNQWYPITDGLGFSLVIVDENAPWFSWGDKLSWRASGAVNGSPGASPDPRPQTPDPIVLVNEVLTQTLPPAVDAVELFNPTTNAVNVGGWFLTDNFSAPKKFRLTNGTVIPPGGHLVFTETNFNPNPGVPPSFTFSSLGEEVFLFAADAATNLTGYYHGFSFGAAGQGTSFGRHVTSVGEEHFVAQAANTFGGANAGPRVGPVVITEIMYHPPDNGTNDDTLGEFIELQNLSTNAVKLFDASFPTNSWRVRGGVSFNFPANFVLGPCSNVVLVSFNPATDTASLASFRSRYGLSPGVPLLGPFSGKLDNSADVVELRQPDAPNLDVVPYVVVETVAYRDFAPWPANADGLGGSLQRLRLAPYANDPANWQAAAPAPGVVPLTMVAQPASATATVGTNAAFLVAACGVPPLRYQWFFNGMNLPQATNATLVFNPVVPSQAGSYYVVVNGSGAVTSAVATLAVLDPDSDGDGFSDYQELLAGTDPRDGASYLKLEAFLPPELADSVVLRFLAVSNRSYTIQFQNSLGEGEWNFLQNFLAMQTTVMVETTNSNTGNATRFYRLVTPITP